MKKLILILCIFFSVSVSSQVVYKCDSTAFYPDMYERAYRVRPENVTITIDGKAVSINHADTLIENFKIIDTLMKVVYPEEVQVIMYTIENKKNPKDQRVISMAYFGGVLQTFGILKENNELTMYRVKLILNHG